MLQASGLPRFKNSLNLAAAVQNFKVIQTRAFKRQYFARLLVVFMVVINGPGAIYWHYRLDQLSSGLSLVSTGWAARQMLVILVGNDCNFKFDVLNSDCWDQVGRVENARADFNIKFVVWRRAKLRTVLVLRFLSWHSRLALSHLSHCLGREQDRCEQAKKNDRRQWPCFCHDLI